MVRPNHSKKFWVSTAALCGVGILYLSVIPVPDGPDIPFLDKPVHVAMYAVFAWLLVQAIRATQLEDREYVLMAWIYATSYGLLIEMIQAMLPWRSADWADAVSNAVGAALGVWLGQRFPKGEFTR